SGYIKHLPRSSNPPDPATHPIQQPTRSINSPAKWPAGASTAPPERGLRSAVTETQADATEVAPTGSGLFLHARQNASTMHVAPRGVTDGRILLTTHSRRFGTAPRPPARPLGPVLPPRSAVPLRRLPPLLRGDRVRRLGHLVPGLRARRVHDAGDVAAAGEHVTDVPAHQAGRLVGRGPGHDVVVDSTDHIHIILD